MSAICRSQSILPEPNTDAELKQRTGSDKESVFLMSKRSLTMKRSLTRYTIALCIMFALVHTFNALYVSFVPLYLQDLSFNGAQRGMLLAIGPFISIFTQTVWGTMADKSKNKAHVMMLLAGGLSVAILILTAAGKVGSMGYVTAFVIAGLALYACFQNPMLPLIDTISLEYVQTSKPKIQYSIIRMMGTISFVVCAYAVGYLIDASRMGTAVIMPVYLCIIAALFISLFFVPKIAGGQKEKEHIALRMLFHDHWYTLLIAGGFVVSASYGFNTSNFTTYLRTQLGAGETVIGIATAVSSTLEIFLFFFMRKITRKTGIINLYLFCILAATVRWFLTGLVRSIPVLVAVQFFTQPFTWGILIYTIAIYIQKAIPEKMHARAQTMMNMLLQSLARIIGTLAGSLGLHLFGETAVPQIYLTFGFLCGVTLVIIVFLCRKMGWTDRKAPPGLELTEDSVV